MKIELSGHYGYRRIVKTMAPMVATMIVISTYSVVDGLVVSNFVGNTAFAAMNLIWPVLSMIAAFGQMIGAGGSALVSKTLGEGNPVRAREIFSMLVRVSLVFGVLVALLLIASMEHVVLALGSDGAMLPYAVSYGRIVALALPFYIVQMAFQSFYMTAELPQLGTLSSIVCGLLNVGLDLLFVAVFGWGLEGAAIATAVSLAFGGLFPLCWFSSRRNRSTLRFVRSGRDIPSLVKTCSNGVSEYVGNISLNIVGICYNLQLMKYVGENGVSAYGIIMYIAFIFAAVFMGYNMGISQIIAFNYGAGNRKELTSLLRKSLVLVAAGGLAMTLVSEISARAVCGFFVSSDPGLHGFATRAVRIYMLSFLLCGFNMFASAWFTALNNGTVSAVSAFARTLVFELGAVFLLPVLLGIDGIWLSVSVAEVFACIMSAILILSFRKRYGY